MQTQPPNSSADPVLQYAVSVVDRQQIAGPLVRAACQRHLDDLEHGPKRGLYWDLPSAQRVFRYFGNVLHLAGGEHEGKPFSLALPQQFIIGSLHGWKLESDGRYRFTTSFTEMAKGGGKSPLAGGLGLYKMTSDGEARAECYAAAVDKDQAKIPFGDAVAMVDLSPDLTAHIMKTPEHNPDVKKIWNLAHLESGSFFRPIASENMGRGKSGFRPYYVLLDEIHEHPTDSMVEFMRKNIKGRRNALVFMITNSGIYDIKSVCWRYHDYCERMLAGQIANDDEMFAYICGLDKDDDWTDRGVWPKAQPMLGVSISYAAYEKEVREAIGMPSKQSLTKRLNFCVWEHSADPLFEAAVWLACGGPVDPERLRGRKCWGALDLSKKNDLTALVLVFEPDEPYVEMYDCKGCGASFESYEAACPRCEGPAPELRYPVTDANKKDVLLFAWTPEETIKKKEKTDTAPYGLWVEQGHLIAVPGKVIKYSFVAHKMAEITSRYDVECFAFDRYRIDDLKTALDEVGATVTLKEWGQGFKDMTPAIEALEDDVLLGLLRHGNNPVLTSAIGNAKVVPDPAEGRKFDKEKSTSRIDPAVALAMASGLMASQPQSEGTYESTVI